MIKSFYINKKSKKIEFTKEELEKLLNEVWLDGKNSGIFTWTSPGYWTSPYYWSTSSNTKDLNTATITTAATNMVTPSIDSVLIKIGEEAKNATRNNE